MTTDNLDALRSQWSTLYTQTLPKLARSKDPAQTRWPVTLDHCFARIILDNIVGRGVLQWDNVIKKPAVHNMTEAQLKDAIRLGEDIQTGKANLAELDYKSLAARGKNEKKYNTAEKRGREEESGTIEKQRSPRKRAKRDDEKQSTLSFTRASSVRENTDRFSSPAQISSKSTSLPKAYKSAEHPFPNPNTVEFLEKIQGHAGLTPYRKRLYSTLLSVPPGTYTTYQAMATYLNSSARAIGNGMRNNPFAPDVPCHRVLASDGSIGGFYGSWGEEGKYAKEKRELLRGEGVFFDSRGKVKGPIFRKFEDLSEAVTTRTDRG